jgi:hypothetical protein
VAAQLKRVDVHFEDAQGIPRTIFIFPTKVESKQVKVIFLHDSAKDHLKDFNNVTKKKIEDAPEGSLQGDVAALVSTRNSGFSDICYLIGSSLHCWLP